VERLRKSVKLPRKNVVAELSQVNAYTRHKDRHKTFQRNPVIVIDRLTQMQADLMDVSQSSRYNRGVKFILVVVDCFSKMLYCETVKNKTGPLVASAFDKVFQRLERTPEKLQVDKGTCHCLADFHRNKYCCYSRQRVLQFLC
jgi:hypothetical protein